MQAPPTKKPRICDHAASKTQNSCPFDAGWSMRNNHLSPDYTTTWEGLMRVR